MRRSATALALLALAAGCQRPMTFTTLAGGRTVYPDDLLGKPAILAFLDANDRRCDRVIPSLWTLSNRPGSPALVVGVMVYDDLSFVHKIETLDYADTLTVLMDPERRLTRKLGVGEFPTFVFLSVEGDVLERTTAIARVPAWIDDESIYRRALPK
jgi:hypothetical protein